MKATELKLGDWVYFDNPAREKKEAAKVVAILNDVQVNIVRMEDNAPLLVVISDMLPIPLTSEILEKNGFNHHKDEEYDFWMEKEHYFCLDVRSGGSFHYCQKKVEYVHELQHLLWALGIDDDLKI